jgi:hypothetical protein
MKRHEILFKMKVVASSLENQARLLSADVDNGDNDITVRMVKRTQREIEKLGDQLEAFTRLL